MWQFCINHANEKLQLHFNRYNFTLERELYLREGIPLVESDFVDNSASVDLIENKTWGIQVALYRSINLSIYIMLTYVCVSMY